MPLRPPRPLFCPPQGENPEKGTQYSSEIQRQWHIIIVFVWHANWNLSGVRLRCSRNEESREIRSTHIKGIQMRENSFTYHEMHSSETITTKHPIYLYTY